MKTFPKNLPYQRDFHLEKVLSFVIQDLNPIKIGVIPIRLFTKSNKKEKENGNWIRFAKCLDAQRPLPK